MDSLGVGPQLQPEKPAAQKQEIPLDQSHEGLQGGLFKKRRLGLKGLKSERQAPRLDWFVHFVGT